MTVNKKIYYITCAPDFIFFDEKKIGRSWMIFDMSRMSNIESNNSQNGGLEDYNNSRTSNMAFLMD